MTTVETVEKPALRQSSILTFLDCQVRYYFRWIEGIKRPPNSALAFGSSFHKTADYNYAQKRETHEDRPTKELQDYFASNFSERAEEVEWTPEEQAQKIKHVRGQLIDKGKDCVAVYQQIVAPTVQPVSSEEPIRIAFDGDYPYDLMTEGIDLIAEPAWIVDSKTAGKSPPASQAERSLQLTLYSLMYRVSKKQVETGLRLDHVVKTKTPKIVQQETQRTDAQLKTALNLIGRVVLNIEHAKQTGAFVPADPQWWGCSESWCGYWHICEFGGKK